MDPTNYDPVPGDSGDIRGDTGAEAAAAEEAPARGPAQARVVRLVAGDYLLTVNPVDGSEIEPCPPGELPARPERHDAAERAELRRAAAPPPPARPAGPQLPLVGRSQERERLGRLLSRGRSVRLTGPAGSGRTALLDALAEDCATLAPDGVVRLCGHQRSVTELLHELFTAVHHAPLYRPDRAELLAHVREIGAVVVLDDLEFGGAQLDELLDATPECAWLLAATPEVAAPSADSHLEEVFLSGLDRTDCLELLEAAVGRALTDQEADWAADVWFDSEGLPLRVVQAGALLRLGAAVDGEQRPPVRELAVELAGRLSEQAREALRFALALGGELPHQAQLPALVGDTHADAAAGELASAGLVTAAGARYRLAPGVAEELIANGRGEYGTDAGADSGSDSRSGERVLSAAQHYSWWAGHPSVAPERIAAEADAVLAVLAALVAGGRPGQPSAAVLLARTAAPAFAAALHWGAWERALRHGQQAARVAGEVGEEAYFHHELGVLALCTGQVERARAELETSVGMRGALADKRGAVAGRRALALVEDRSRQARGAGAGTPSGVSGAGVKPGALPGSAGPRSVRPGVVPPSAVPPAVAPPAVVPPSVPPVRPADDATTAIISRVSAVPGPSARPSGVAGVAGTARSAQGAAAPQGWAKKLMAGGNRRNLTAAGAGVLFAAVLGTVVTIGATSGKHGDDGGPADRVSPRQSASQQDDNGGMSADQPVTGESGRPPVPGLPGRPGHSAGPGAEPSASHGATGGPAPSTPGQSGAPVTHSPQPSDTETGEPTHTGSPSPTDKPSPSKTADPGPTGKPSTPGPSPVTQSASVSAPSKTKG
ncbi:AAA family ATPase [Streptomyces orinoci]|uniref:ATP-binding protein n=1 Tax=Streptomyces orinoci TaxID=67339 RepID=A0ABV3JTC3_STRON|nr:AAA family ATPase [Streptomyces orinoci]